MMYLTRCTIGVLVAALLTGCAAERRSTGPAGTRDALPGVSAYYEQVVKHQRRAVRKPVRDQRALALRELARSSDTLLAQSRDWDADARLVALAEPERSTVRSTVGAFRASLADLRSAATRSDVAALHREYRRASAAYRELNRLTALKE